MVDEAWALAAGRALSYLPDLQKSKLGGGELYEIQNLCFSVGMVHKDIYISLKCKFLYKYYGCLPSENFVGTCQRQIC